MPRNFFYLYSEEPNLQDGPEHDADDTRPIPVKGDTVNHNGRNWRVDTVSLIRTMYPKRSSQPPMEVLVTLAPN